ncbi:MAG: acylphosphatase, partial [Candidatus Latescibacteria bacterium]|nr:acylphosphatase [Candidatus Latescibacterota bacterium]
MRLPPGDQLRRIAGPLLHLPAVQRHRRDRRGPRPRAAGGHRRRRGPAAAPAGVKVAQALHPPLVRLRLVIHGAVQGVGFRPFVFRLAGQLGLTGWVNNSP